MCQRGDDVDRQGRTIAEQPARTALSFQEKRRATCPGMTKQLRPLMLHLFRIMPQLLLHAMRVNAVKRKKNRYRSSKTRSST